ncbi:MAG: hypothetical protein Q7R82_02285 [Candidatus Daviesbacteria bacterium]|nr:hypothetical protein [Candidatus Daviesbacteria bacterium]
MKNMKNKKLTIIAGPCAAESKQQIMASLKEAKKRQVDFVRISLWKPRTKPGFDGLGKSGIPLLIEAVKMGVNPATEVLLPNHAKMIMDAVLPVLKKGKLLLWIGARNQNHLVQQNIAKVASKDNRVILLVKNQPWTDEKHWEGIIEHVLTGGVSKNRLILCHRGFIPNGHNPLELRNVPDYEMSMRIKSKVNLPMIFDPSHTGGSVFNVLKLANEASKYDFDGVMIEVHPDPINALTDAKQQLTWKQFDKLMKVYAKD